MEVILAINEGSFEGVKKRVEKALELPIEWAQLDIGDGVVGGRVTWHNSEDLDRLPADLKYEVHFMSRGDYRGWLRPPIKRFILQLESGLDVLGFKNDCLERGIESGLSITAGTAIGEFNKYLEEFNFWQVLGVHPGESGQEFKEEALELIKYLRDKKRGDKIEVDGGVNEEVARKAKEAGADILVSDSFIFRSRDMREAHKKLREI